MHSSLNFRNVVTGGTWCVDHNKRITEWPNEDLSAEILEMNISGGGSACNFAIDLVLLCPEIKVATIAIVGNDDNGRFLKSVADDYGINTDQFRVLDNRRTHFSEAYTSAKSGRRTHIYHTGCSDQLSVDDFNFDGFEGRFLHLGLSGIHAKLDSPNGKDLTGWVSVLKKAKRSGLTTNLEMMSGEDPHLIAQLNRPSLPFLDLLIVNDWEIQALSGRTPTACNDGGVRLIAAAKEVLAAGTMGLVVVHEPDLAICISRDGEPIILPSFAVPNETVVGTNGAGDAFTAGFICGLHRGNSLLDCLACGHAAAAASMRDITPYGSVRTLEECLETAGRPITLLD